MIKGPRHWIMVANGGAELSLYVEGLPIFLAVYAYGAMAFLVWSFVDNLFDRSPVGYPRSRHLRDALSLSLERLPVKIFSAGGCRC